MMPQSCPIEAHANTRVRTLQTAWASLTALRSALTPVDLVRVGMHPHLPFISSALLSDYLCVTLLNVFTRCICI